MEKFIVLNGWKNKVKNNGSLLAELIISITIAALVVGAYLPILGKTFAFYYFGKSQENLARQVNVFDETIFLELRYGKLVSIDDNYIKFVSITNHDAGYIVDNTMLYRIMDNGTKQPMIGNDNIQISGCSSIRILPYDNLPFFSEDHGMIFIRMLLFDERSRAEWPCLITVVPINDLWKE